MEDDIDFLVALILSIAIIVLVLLSLPLLNGHIIFILIGVLCALFSLVFMYTLSLIITILIRRYLR